MTRNEPRPDDPVPGIVASGRQITADDVEMIWADFIERRYSWQETSARALALVETVNVPSHVVNGALLDLYYLWQPDAVRDLGAHRAMREAWRETVKRYDADPLEWDRPFYQDMLRRRAAEHGTKSARDLALQLVSDRLLRQKDADAVLDDLPSA